MDACARIVDAVNAARSEQRRLTIAGSGSKRDWLAAAGGELLVTTECRGIISYDPAELVVTARAGTPIRDLVGELAQHGQMLAFEPPQFYGGGTVGGMVAAGLSGPSRPWSGSVRDAVLGVELVNGLGQRLNFGGQVMKNVAGYDVARLTAGAYGALGVLLSVSLRVQPLLETTMTLQFELDAQAANDLCRQLARQYLPLTGTWWYDHRLYLRLAGSAAAVKDAMQQLGGERAQGDGPWSEVTHHSHDFFKVSSPADVDRAEQSLWRVIVPPASPVGEHTSLALEWAGGLRWLWHSDESLVRAYAQERQGWAWAMAQPVRLEPVVQQTMRAIKAAFDPDDLFVSPLALSEPDAH